MTMRKTYFRALTLFAFALLVLSCSSQMYATTTTELTLSDGFGNSVTINNGTVTHTGSVTVTSDTFNASTDTITFIGAVGGFSFNVTAGTGGAGEPLPTLEDLSSTDTSSGAGTLTVTFSDTGYTDLAPAGFTLGVSGTENLAIDNSKVTFSAYGSSTNAVPATTLIGTLGPVNGLSFSTSGNFANPIGTSGSLTEVTTIAFTGAGQIGEASTISNVVPEPTSVVLLGGALVFIAGTMRRKLKKG